MLRDDRIIDQSESDDVVKVHFSPLVTAVQLVKQAPFQVDPLEQKSVGKKHEKTIFFSIFGVCKNAETQ